MQPLECAAAVVETALVTAKGWQVVCQGYVFAAFCSFSVEDVLAKTTAHPALLMSVWPALGIPWGTECSNAAFVACSRCGGACTGYWGRAGQVVCGGCGFPAFWRFSGKEALLGNHIAQSPASVFVARPGFVMGHCKVKCSLCNVQQGLWSLL